MNKLSKLGKVIWEKTMLDEMGYDRRWVDENTLKYFAICPVGNFNDIEFIFTINPRRKNISLIVKGKSIGQEELKAINEIFDAYYKEN